MRQGLLLVALFLVSLPGQALTKYRPSFYDRAMAGIRTPAVERMVTAGRPEVTLSAASFSTTPGWQPQRPFYLYSIPGRLEPSSKNLSTGGIILIAIGGAGIALGAASMENGSSENAVAISLIVSSAILALIGAGVMIAGASK